MENVLLKAEYLQQHHQFSPDAIPKLLSSGKYLIDPENCDSVLFFFKEIGFSTTQIQETVKCYPSCLSANIDRTIKPKIKLLQDAADISPTQILELIAATPWILHRGIDRIGLTISDLKRLLGPSLDLFRFFKKANSSRFTTPDLIPNVELLLSCGISSSQISTVMHRNSRFLCQDHEQMKKRMHRVEEDMCCDRTSNSFIHALLAIGSQSVESWQHKWGVFRSWGFREDDIRAIFWRYPKAYSTSERKIQGATSLV